MSYYFHVAMFIKLNLNIEPCTSVVFWTGAVELFLKPVFSAFPCAVRTGYTVSLSVTPRSCGSWTNQ